MTAAAWDAWDASRVDDEETILTLRARELTRTSIAAAVRRGLVGEDYRFAVGGAVLRVLANGYVTEVRGQSSSNGHGRQGAHPARIAALRALPVAVRVVFVDVGDHWQAVWLGRAEPEVVNIALAADHRRQGWRVRELERGTGLFPFPAAAPEPVEAPQGALL